MAAETSASDESGAVKRLTGALNGVRVMLVDDDDDCLDLAGEVLRRAGADVHCYPSAATAFDALRGLDPDVIVSDIGMPLESGYGFMQRVRRSDWPRARVVPALAVTAFVTAADKTEAIASGFDAHLSKPTPPSVLIGAVGDAYRGSRFG